MSKKVALDSNNKPDILGNENVKVPSIRILGQYVKDLSFENPNAPASFNAPSPEISITVNVNTKSLGDSNFEVELKINLKAIKSDKVAFLADLSYCGIMKLEGVPEELTQPLLLVECPRLLFPFARQIIAEIIQNGGFPPVMLDPIDFRKFMQAKQPSNN